MTNLSTKTGKQRSRSLVLSVCLLGVCLFIGFGFAYGWLRSCNFFGWSWLTYVRLVGALFFILIAPVIAIMLSIRAMLNCKILPRRWPMLLSVVLDALFLGSTTAEVIVLAEERYFLQIASTSSQPVFHKERIWPLSEFVMVFHAATQTVVVTD